MDAVELLTTDQTITADGARANSLPTIQGKHGDLNTITSDTVRILLLSRFEHSKEVKYHSK